MVSLNVTDTKFRHVNAKILVLFYLGPSYCSTRCVRLQEKNCNPERMNPILIQKLVFTEQLWLFRSAWDQLLCWR
jgi:hypothetical protein